MILDSCKEEIGTIMKVTIQLYFFYPSKKILSFLRFSFLTFFSCFLFLFLVNNFPSPHANCIFLSTWKRQNRVDCGNGPRMLLC